MLDCSQFAPEDDAAWLALREQWQLRSDTTYLNHGSFGPPPRAVREARAVWQARLDEQPMDFLVRQYESAWFAARESLARFVGATPGNLVFAENATAAMNHVAASFPLAPGDEVLLTDHEYGAVLRIWQRACVAAGAEPPVIAALPRPFTTAAAVVAAIEAQLTPRTRLVVVSHITSPTAVTLPVKEICAALKPRGIAVCIDGPHAIAQLPLAIEELGCDYYCASCHKWLCALFGSGFLYVAPKRQATAQPASLSWGRVLPEDRKTWCDEFIWSGTRDSSPWLAIPAAIEFLEDIGLDAFRRRSHHLAQYARRRLVELIQREPLVPDDPAWYTSMAHVPLPPGDAKSLQLALWKQHGIEIPIIAWGDARWIRVSCHLYNSKAEIDRLVAALPELW